MALWRACTAWAFLITVAICFVPSRLICQLSFSKIKGGQPWQKNVNWSMLQICTLPAHCWRGVELLWLTHITAAKRWFSGDLFHTTGLRPWPATGITWNTSSEKPVMRLLHHINAHHVFGVGAAALWLVLAGSGVYWWNAEKETRWLGFLSSHSGNSLQFRVVILICLKLSCMLFSHAGIRFPFAGWSRGRYNNVLIFLLIMQGNRKACWHFTSCSKGLHGLRLWWHKENQHSLPCNFTTSKTFQGIPQQFSQ